MKIKNPLHNFKLEIETIKNQFNGEDIYVQLIHKQLPIVFAEWASTKPTRDVLVMNISLQDVVNKLYNNFMLCMKYGKAQLIKDVFTRNNQYEDLYTPEYDIEKEAWFIIKDNDRIYEIFE